MAAHRAAVRLLVVVHPMDLAVRRWVHRPAASARRLVRHRAEWGHRRMGCRRVHHLISAARRRSDLSADGCVTMSLEYKCVVAERGRGF